VPAAVQLLGGSVAINATGSRELALAAGRLARRSTRLHAACRSACA